jgi:hypothetical protein
MTVARGRAAAVMCAGLAVGTAGTAWAYPTMSGHYTDTETAQSGLKTTNDWYATPCGDGCTSINYNGGSLAQAQFVNGQWLISPPLGSSSWLEFYCRERGIRGAW